MPIYWINEVSGEVQNVGQAMSDMDFAELAAALTALSWTIQGGIAYFMDNGGFIAPLCPWNCTFLWYWGASDGKDATY